MYSLGDDKIYKDIYLVVAFDVYSGKYEYIFASSEIDIINNYITKFSTPHRPMGAAKIFLCESK